MHVPAQLVSETIDQDYVSCVTLKPPNIVPPLFCGGVQGFFRFRNHLILTPHIRQKRGFGLFYEVFMTQSNEWIVPTNFGFRGNYQCGTSKSRQENNRGGKIMSHREMGYLFVQAGLKR